MPAQRVIPHAPNRSWGVNNIIGYRISPTTHEEEPLCEWDNTYIAYGKFSNPDQARRDVAAIKRRRRSSPPHPNSDLPPPPGQALPVPLSDPTPNPPLRSTLPCRPPPPPSDPAPDTPICSTSLCRPPLSPNPPALPLRPLHMLPPRPKHRGKRGGGLEHQQRSQDILKKSGHPRPYGIERLAQRIGSGASKPASYNRESTITAREIQTAVRLILPGELYKHAISEGTKSVTKYSWSK
ncbi:unnamed protein product [Tilletia laevis]|nr:unnamed protein product [Tilletia laevis]CAD6980620.1 unnamed protein product [Tilletia controversa]